MTETQALEARITAALTTIRREWDAMMPKGAPGRSPGGAKSAGIVSDNSDPEHRLDGTPFWASDHADTSQDIDSITRLASQRREVVESLNGWSRVIIDDRIMPTLEASNKSVREIREYLTRVLPHGQDVHGMSAFLDRHAQWMSGHEAAETMADDLETLARKVLARTKPQRREWMSLGSCPLEIETDEGQHGDLEMTICSGQVRAWPQAEDRDGEVMARCRRCGTEAVATWWEARMFANPEARKLLTYDDVAALAHRVLGYPVQRATVKMWKSRGVIEPSGEQDEKGRTLFALDATVYALDLWKRREAV